MTDIPTLIAEGKKAALSTAHDDCLLISDLVDALEAQQAGAGTLFDAIKHGDGQHQAWLKEAITNHFAGLPVPVPRGKGNKEKMQAVVEAARDGRRLIGMMTNVSIAAGCKCIDDAIAALDALKEGEKP